MHVSTNKSPLVHEINRLAQTNIYMLQQTRQQRLNRFERVQLREHDCKFRGFDRERRRETNQL